MSSDAEAYEEVAPDPSALIESMRAFGYALPTAVADLIDNSISAGARMIDVDFAWRGSESHIAVVDDGRGMNRDGLVEAMRLGSRSPVEVRAANDLGRFGLGLKSAAWSQGRSLTAVSRAAGDDVHLRRWDLDHVARSKRWYLLAEPTAHGQAFVELISKRESGTAVVVEQLDRLVGGVSADDSDATRRFWEGADRTARHLGVVFHRFLVGRNAVAIRLNGTVIAPWDPFLATHPATQALPTEVLSSRGNRIEVAPYVLPHVSKLSKSLHEAAAGAKGWNAQQGFYVYRGRRLLVAGGWMGLRRTQQEEHYKLARIRIDLPNTADAQWQIDVRKATARIPGPLVESLDRIAKTTRKRASDAYRFRGKVIARNTRQDGSLSFIWQTATLRAGATSFVVNRKHPTIMSLRASSPDAASAVERTLRLVEESLPVDAIVMDARDNPDRVPEVPFKGDQLEVEALLKGSHEAMVGRGVPTSTALDALSQIEPFRFHPEVIQAFRESLTDA